LVPTLVGHDGLPPPAGAQSQGFNQEVDRLAALAASADGDFFVLGYSLGARLALGLLVQHSELFRGALLIGAQPGLETEAERAERRALDARWIELLETQGIERFVDAWGSQPLFGTQRRLPSESLHAQRRLRLAHHPAGLALSLRALGLSEMPSLRTELGRLGMPVELWTGELDGKFCAIADELSTLLPDARRITVAGVGHNLVLERPELIAEALRRTQSWYTS
jgi:2-succinyl-6-hydroxy-2,4-cyclohexadiene-1-carboxylate synthase